MEKLFLLSGKQYKAELHTHTTCSDGKYTPNESKELYLKRGFSIVAFSDHDVFVPHHDELSDDKFIALNAFELAIPSFSEDELSRAKQVHLNYIATEPTITNMPFYNPKYIYHKGAKEFIGKIPYEGEIEDRKPDVAWLNYAIQKGNENGFLVVYNHPVWSLSQPNDYLPLNGLFGMEVFNTSGSYSAPEDGVAWREMVYDGKDIKCIAANDFHREQVFDAMQAATYIFIDDFSYEGVINALKAGKTYSSTGPIINELSVYDGKIHISCSPVKMIRIFSTKSHREFKVASADDFVTEVEFTILPQYNDMFYVQLIDEAGNQALSNPIFNLGMKQLEQEMTVNPKRTLFLHDKMVSYDWLSLLDNEVAHSYFSSRLIIEQVDEIINHCKKFNYEQIIVQFSSSEIVGYDYIFDIGEEEIKKLQQQRLNELSSKLDSLIAYAKDKNIKLTFLSMLPLPHSADIYDYRNNYARSINALIKHVCFVSKFEFYDVATALMNDKGILDEKYNDNPTYLTERFFIEKYNEN